VKKLLALIIGLSMLAVIYAGCGGSGPVETFNRFVHEVQFDHMEAVWREVSKNLQADWPRNFVDESTGEKYDSFDLTFHGSIQAQFRDGATVKDSEINGDHAVLKCSIGAWSGQMATITLVKENGVWKVDDYIGK